MTSILFSNLMQETLKELSKEDYVARSLLGYIYEMNSLKKVVEAASKGKVSSENLLSEYKKMSDCIKNISILFKSEIKNYPTKLRNENDFDKLTMVYINENFMKLCPDINLSGYYQNLHKILNGFIEAYDIDTLGAVALRSVKIVNELYKGGNLKAIERFLSALEIGKARKNDNIVYMVYYGLFCNQNSHSEENIDTDKNIEPGIIREMLNDVSKLPDSIIKHLFKDKQFKKYNSRVLVCMMECIFMVTDDMEPEGYPLLISKILNNNLDNMDEEAKFYDLSDLYTKFEARLNNKCSNAELFKLLSDIVCETIILDDVDDDMEDSYGTV